jgi:hypothetical protein
MRWRLSREAKNCLRRRSHRLARRSGVIAAADINIAASLACTIAARPTVRTAARAPLNTRRGVVRPLCLREPQTCSFGCLPVGCNCDMSWPLAV